MLSVYSLLEGANISHVAEIFEPATFSAVKDVENKLSLVNRVIFFKYVRPILAKIALFKFGFEILIESGVEFNLVDVEDQIERHIVGLLGELEFLYKFLHVILPVWKHIHAHKRPR
jgi:hypothetical protein